MYVQYSALRERTCIAFNSAIYCKTLSTKLFTVAVSVSIHDHSVSFQDGSLFVSVTHTLTWANNFLPLQCLFGQVFLAVFYSSTSNIDLVTSYSSSLQEVYK